jgi:hypothetical protein
MPLTGFLVLGMLFIPVLENPYHKAGGFGFGEVVAGLVVSGDGVVLLGEVVVPLGVVVSGDDGDDGDGKVGDGVGDGDGDGNGDGDGVGDGDGDGEDGVASGIS